jgi:hypothetical protein
MSFILKKKDIDKIIKNGQNLHNLDLEMIIGVLCKSIFTDSTFVILSKKRFSLKNKFWNEFDDKESDSHFKKELVLVDYHISSLLEIVIHLHK